MVFADWTIATSNGSCSLDAATKYAGASSARLLVNAGGGTATLTHDNFSSTQVQIIAWVRRQYSTVHIKLKHLSYGDLETAPTVINTWERFKVNFWYDISSNIKWGRIERWTGSAWTQVGSDTNFGSGSPSAGSIVLNHTSGAGSAWVDEVEVYS